MKLYFEHRWMEEEKKDPWKFIEDTNDPHHPCKINVMNITWSDQSVQKTESNIERCGVSRPLWPS